MDKLITSYSTYSIWQLSENNLYELAEFVVSENYKHHTNGQVNTNFLMEVANIHKEEKQYFNHSCVFVAKNTENKIIGAIRLIHWNGEEVLPIQTLFGIQPLIDIMSTDSNTLVWHIGRLAVSSDIGRYGPLLFKLLLLYAMYPIYKCKKGVVYAECDSKLLRIMLLMGIQIQILDRGINYLGSKTIPVYATQSGLTAFFQKTNRFCITSLIYLHKNTQKCIFFKIINNCTFVYCEQKRTDINLHKEIKIRII